MKTNRIIVQLKNGNAVLREIELTPEDGELITEAIRFYWFNSERFEKEMMENGTNRLRMASFYLKNDLAEILEKLK